MRDKTQIVLGATLLSAYAAFWRWHSPKAEPLTNDEIDDYLRTISKIPMPGDDNERLVERLRAWAAADDGKQVLMLNLIRFFPELRRFPGAPDFQGTPQESNAFYEKSLTSLWLRNASYPRLGGGAQGKNLIETHPGDEPWSAAKMVRYPSRRKFLQLLSDPSYAPLEPYKLTSMELDLVAVSADQQIPDARLAVGGAFLALFLAMGWRRATRR